MSTRPASPPPVARWPFVLGDVLCFAVAATALIFGESPPGLGTMLILFLSVAIGVWCFVTPYLKDHEDQVRMAEAQVREHTEAQLRRLTQTTEQLGNAISRSQSTEEQAGQALGTIEELTEKLNTQAEELAQSLARSHEREIATLKTEIEKLGQERDDRFAALDQRLDTVTGQISEHQLASKKAAAAAHKALDDVKERLIALAGRLEEIALNGRVPAIVSTPLAAPASVTPAPAPALAATPPAAPAPEVRDEPPTPETPPTSTRHIRAASGAGEADTVLTVTPASSPVVTPKSRARRTSEAPAQAPSRISAKTPAMELPLLDLGEERPTVHRDASGGTSTLVATAYIGIGNKLYVRGDGPGLSWNQGVPMQFLAIGKWGWTSPTAAEPITCRIYRNDETPMLDDNIVIAPGSKAEVTPRF